MPRDGTTGIYTRVTNSFSDPVLGEVIDPNDATSFWTDLTDALNSLPTVLATGVTPGSVLFVGAAPDNFVAEDNTHFFWDESKVCLSIGALPSVTGTGFELYKSLDSFITNATMPNDLITFSSPISSSNSINAWYVGATWNASAAQKGFTLAVENIGHASAPASGSNAAIYGGTLNKNAGNDPAGVIGVINNLAGVTPPAGAAIWALIRGDNASSGSVDGLRASSEVDPGQHPRYGMVVTNSGATNAFGTGALVSGAVDYGFLVGVGTNGAAEVTPTNPYGFLRKTDGNLRFNVDSLGGVTGSTVNILDTDINSLKWTFQQRIGGVLGLFQNGVSVLDFVSAASGGPQLAIKGSTSGNTNLAVAAVASGVLTLPSANDTLIARATTDTLTNKTLNTANNTFTVNGVSLDSAWTTYTPTITASAGTFTTVSATGSYKQVGKTVFVRITISITTNGTASGRVEATLPVAVGGGTSTQALCGFNGSTAAVLAAAISPTVSTTKVLLFTATGTYPGANATELDVQGVYEVP